MTRWASYIDAIRDAIAVREAEPAPAHVARHARLLVLDTLGCALAGRMAPEVAALEAQLASLEPGGFAFPGGRGLGVRAACQLLAIAPTWHEACEGHAFAHGRPGVPAIAALLPLAVQQDLTLGAFVDALVVGYEVGARAGGWLRVGPGIHVDGNWPGLGVAAGVARLHRLSADAAMRAVAIAACQLPSSLYLPIRTGRNVRNLYLAHSATLGMDSALAAQAGIDAPPDALAEYAEHHCRASSSPLPPPAADLILDAYLKPFAAVRHVHYGAIGARRVREQLRGDTTGITGIDLTIYEEATVYCANPQPQTLLAAQFSLSFGIAAMLRFGKLDASSYESPDFFDAELRRLEALVQVRVDPALSARAERGASLQVTAAGRSFEQQVGAGDPELLLDAEGVVEKFVHNGSASLSAQTGRAFAADLLGCAKDTRLRELWQAINQGA